MAGLGIKALLGQALVAIVRASMIGNVLDFVSRAFMHKRDAALQHMLLPIAVARFTARTTLQCIEMLSTSSS